MSGTMDKNKVKLPDFIVCGFQKCATSALSRTLDMHPQISIARNNHELKKNSNGKEFDFFKPNLPNSTYYEGLNWYKSHFKQDDNLWAEVSPNYSDNVQTVVKCMKLHLHNKKFVFSIRNPIYRTYSAYNHFMQLFREKNIKYDGWDHTRSFIYNVKTHPTVFTRNYNHILKIYENEFGKENIFIFCQERLASDDYQTEYNKFFKFLKVDSVQIDNMVVHKRKYDRQITNEEIDFLKNLYKDQVKYLFDNLGYEIKEWTEFC